MFIIVFISFLFFFITILLITNKSECKRELKYKVSQYNQDLLLFYHFFQNKENGYFIELGAYDGIDTSNTYFFEKNLNWHGILIEGGPKNCKALQNNAKYRNNSIIICSPICSANYVDFNDNKKIGGIIHNNNSSSILKCNTIKNITTFFNIKHIDLFSLDVEGSELEVIETFDFHVTVSHWMIEWFLLDKSKKEKILKILESNGYYMDNTFISNIDKIFTRKNVK